MLVTHYCWGLRVLFLPLTYQGLVHILSIHTLRVSASKFLGRIPLGLGIPPLAIKNLTESKL